LKWSGNNTTYEAYFKQYWTGKLGGIEGYEKALQDGVVEPASAPALPPPPSAAPRSAKPLLTSAPGKKAVHSK